MPNIRCGVLAALEPFPIRGPTSTNVTSFAEDGWIALAVLRVSCRFGLADRQARRARARALVSQAPPFALTMLHMRSFAGDMCGRAGHFALVFVLGMSAAFIAFSAVLAGDGYERFLGLYDELLSAHVRSADRGGISYAGVDYDAWASDPRHEEALGLLLGENPETRAAGDVRKAFWINATIF